MRTSQKRLVLLEKRPERDLLALLPCEETVKRHPSMNQDMGPYETLFL